MRFVSYIMAAAIGGFVALRLMGWTMVPPDAGSKAKPAAVSQVKAKT